MRRIKQISVEGLFGTLNHVIPLHTEEKITIVHGPNGVGKTIILRLINDLFSQRNAELRKIPFSKLQVDFDDKSSFWIIKSPEEQASNGTQSPSISTLHFYWAVPGYETQDFELVSSRERWPKINEEAQYIFTLEATSPIPFVRVEAKKWMHQLTGELFSLEDMLEDFGDLFPNLPTNTNTLPEPDWLKELRQSLPIRFIETQRLLSVYNKPILAGRSRPGLIELTITKYAEELASKIREKREESNTIGQVLDKTFPKRVFEPTPLQKSMSEKELRQKLVEQDKKRSRLMAAGLLDQDNSSAFQMGEQVEESQKIMLSVYVEDTEKKLGVFDEISRKINLLTKIINGKQFLNKAMTITKDAGFVFTSTSGEIIPLNKLSSGEQNQLVLFYDLLFKTQPKSLLLLDEPETSLHIVWQKEFLQDIYDIISLTDIDIIIATHSPDLIYKSWDLTVGLGGTVDEGASTYEIPVGIWISR